MKHRKLITLCAYTGMLALFVWVVELIFATHTDVGFWLQSDNTWAPHFVFDLVVNHHSIQHWRFANGTIHLLDTVPFFVFSLFSHNMINWIHWNAIFNLTLFFMAFVLLARAVYPDLKRQLILISSSLIALTLLLYGLQIPFTLDMLLASAQHEMQLLICLMSLPVILIYLKNPNRYWLLVILCLMISVGVFTDEILIASLVLPMLLTLLILYFHKKKITPLIPIACIIFAAIIGRFVWLNAPLNYTRIGTNLSAPLQQIYHGMALYFYTTYYSHPTILLLSLVFFPLGLLVAIRMSLKKEFTPQLLLLIYCLWEWLSGIGRMLTNYHISSAYQELIQHQYLLTTAHFVSVSRDSIDFYIIPIFIGLPLVLIYFGRKILGPMSIALFICLISTLTIATENLIPERSLKQNIATQQQITTCLYKEIQQHHLHAGVANYWISRPLTILSGDKLQLSSLTPGVADSYFHYLSTWDDIKNKTLDFWVARDQRFSQDPVYTSYYSPKDSIAYKLKHFGKPAGQFICGSNRNAVTVYYYRHDEIMKTLLPNIRSEEHFFLGPKAQAKINKENKLQLKLKSNY